MAPSRTRKNAARQVDYSNVGVAGRKTGITLKDSGVRDEHGLEPIEGIFSSPEKPSSTPQSNGNNHTIMEEEDMSMENSTAPDPTDVLPSRWINRPPRSRSPIKTYLNSSPRKSFGTASSMPREILTTPEGTTKGTVGLDTGKHLRSNPAIVEGVPGKNSSATSLHPKKRKRGGLFDISATETEDEEALAVGDVGNSDAVDEYAVGVVIEVENRVDDELPNYEQEELHTRVQDGGIRANATSSPTATQKNQENPQRKAGRPKMAKSSFNNLNKERTSERREPKPPSKGRRGRPRRDAPPRDLHQVASSAEVENDVDKPSRDVNVRREKPPPSRRNAKAQIQSDSHQSLAKRTLHESDFGREKPKTRGLISLRNETPADESGAQVLRSGRTSVRPVAYWRNERIVYDKSNVDGVRLPLPGIKEIIRTEEAPPPEKRTRKRSRRGRKVAESEDDTYADPWEQESGAFEGIVMGWDSEAQRPTDKETVSELALAPKGLEQTIRDVKGARFQYGKLVTLPFFHSGVVDIPPGGEKKKRNSRHNHMVFWVFSGRVEVNVGDSNFSIGRGGMWQVPRGNFYSLRNTYDHPARVFFAQGCHMTEQKGTETEE